MRYLSVCSGIEAATVAWHPLGWEAFAYSEIEGFPSAVLAHHYPDTPNLGDMTKFKEWPHAAIDLLVGGTPCQSFSVAGLRKGLADPRGNLMLTYLAIADQYRPQWLVWENVPGVLSSNGGRDFGTFLAGLGQLGYGFAYRVLDAQYFGVAQRRRRVFVVGCLGNWRAAAAVLFERYSLSGNPAPSREAGEKITGTLGSRASSGGGFSTDFDLDGGLQLARCVTTGEGKRQDYETCTLVAHALRGEGFDASEDGTGRGTPLVPVAQTPNGGRGGIGVGAIAYRTAGDGAVFEEGDATAPLTCGTDQCANVVAWSIMPQNSGKEYKARAVDVAQPIMAGGPVGGNQGGDYIQKAMQVRRLTPRECERLQGFPPIAERVIIQICTDHQSGSVLVELKCLRLQTNASPVDANALTPYAATAEINSSMPRAEHAPLAVLHVLPHSGREEAVLHSHARSNSAANGVNGFEWSHQAALGDGIARGLALTLRDLAHSIRSGKAASRLYMLPFTQAQNGNEPAPMYGDGIAENANIASSDQKQDTFTTSKLGQMRPISDSKEATLCCSALNAIAGYIPEKTLPRNFSLELTVVTDYTSIPVKGKPAKDGPRYKALGNSMAVPVMRKIGERIQMVTDVMRLKVAA